jgi:hypothetical protein
VLTAGNAYKKASENNIAIKKGSTPLRTSSRLTSGFLFGFLFKTYFNGKESFFLAISEFTQDILQSVQLLPGV